MLLYFRIMPGRGPNPKKLPIAQGIPNSSDICSICINKINPKIKHRSNKSNFVFGKSGFQTPGLVPLDSSRNSALFCGIYVSGIPIWTPVCVRNSEYICMLLYFRIMPGRGPNPKELPIAQGIPNSSDIVPTCAGPSCERLFCDSSSPGPLNRIFRSRGRSPDLGNTILGLFGPIRIDMDQVSAQTVEYEPQSSHSCK